MNAQERQHMLATAPIPGLVIRLSVPTIISMMITALYNMADTFFVGQIGTSATAAVGVVFPLMAIIQAGGFFFGHGSGNTISRKRAPVIPKVPASCPAVAFIWPFWPDASSVWSAHFSSSHWPGCLVQPKPSCPTRWITCVSFCLAHRL